MKRLLLQCLLPLLFSFLLQAQHRSDIRILEYSVDASFNDGADRISGSASVWLQVTADSIVVFRFTVPVAMEITAVRDIDDDRYVHEPIPLFRSFNAHAVELPSYRFRNDSFLVTIEFETTVDTSSASSMFLNAREFVLPFTPAAAWLPHFELSVAERASIRFSVPSGYTVAGSATLSASPAGDGRRIWEATRLDRTDLQDFFSVAGSVSLSEKTSISSDSTVSVSLFFTPAHFDPRFADSLAAYLTDAALFFQKVAGHHAAPFSHRFIVAGDPHAQDVILRCGSRTVIRNSPAYALYDTTMFFRTAGNTLLRELARNFCPAAMDSLPLFDRGWAGYLATRYITQRYNNPVVNRRERLDLLFKALSFYPTKPLAAAQSAGPLESEILSSKAVYVFLMLEELLSPQSLDMVMSQFFRRNAAARAGMDEFRRLCEQDYGSSLEQFFRQWLEKTDVPELALRWKNDHTVRGNVLTTVSVEQRGGLFAVPVNLSFTVGNKTVLKRVMVDQSAHTFSFTFSSPPKNVEIDPHYSLLRWILDYRILAHARSSLLYRVLERNITMATREAVLTLELDPVNATGAAPIAYYSLGMISAIEGDLDQAKEYFFQSMQSAAVNETSVFPLLSLVRYANIVEAEGNRSDAIPMYERAKTEGWKNPATLTPVIVEAEQYLRIPFVSGDDVWYTIR